MRLSKLDALAKDLVHISKLLTFGAMHLVPHGSVTPVVVGETVARGKTVLRALSKEVARMRCMQNVKIYVGHLFSYLDKVLSVTELNARYFAKPDPANLLNAGKFSEAAELVVEMDAVVADAEKVGWAMGHLPDAQGTQVVGLANAQVVGILSKMKLSEQLATDFANKLRQFADARTHVVAGWCDDKMS